MSSSTGPGRSLGTPIQMGLAYHPLVQGHGRIVAHAAYVALVVDGHGGHAVILGLVDSHPHGLLRLHEAEAPVAVDDGSVGSFPLHHKGRTRNDVAPVDAAAILQQLNDAVGVVPHQVGLHLVGCDDLRLLFGRALGNVDMVGNLMQVFMGKYGHDANLPGHGLLGSSLLERAGKVYCSAEDGQEGRNCQR